MPTFLLAHTHEPRECDAAFAAWQGHESRLRGAVALATCVFGAHRVYWIASAPDARAALDLLPPFVAERAEVIEVRGTLIP